MFRNIGPNWRRLLTAIAGILALAPSVRAQETELDTTLAEDWLRWGPINLRPRVSAAVTYDDNITLAPNNELSDVFWNFTPGVSLLAGNKQIGEAPWLSLDYDANVILFHQHTEFNDLNHSLGLEGRWPMAKLTLGATAGYELLSTPLNYAAARVDRKLYRLGLTSRYQYSEKTSFEVNGRYSQSDYDSKLVGSKEWSNDTWINHQLTGKLNLGLGATFGYLEPDATPAQDYQRIMARANYTLTYKLALDASAGAEFRQYEGGFSPSVTPVFTLGTTYRPVDRTTIRLAGYRREQNSLTAVNVNQITTGVSLNVRQQMWDRVGVSAGGSYENSEYRTIAGPIKLNRIDDYFAVNVGVDVALTLRWNAALNAQHRENTSDSRGGVVFKDNLVSLQTNYSF